MQRTATALLKYQTAATCGVRPYPEFGRTVPCGIYLGNLVNDFTIELRDGQLSASYQ